MSLKAKWETLREQDIAAQREQERLEFKRAAARALVPILRLLEEKRWAEVSVEIDEYLKVRPPRGLPLEECRSRYLERAMEARWPTSWRSMLDDSVAMGRKFVAMQLEKDQARANAEAQIAEARRNGAFYRADQFESA